MGGGGGVLMEKHKHSKQSTTCKIIIVRSQITKIWYNVHGQKYSNIRNLIKSQWIDLVHGEHNSFNAEFCRVI